MKKENTVEIMDFAEKRGVGIARIFYPNLNYFSIRKSLCLDVS